MKVLFVFLLFGFMVACGDDATKNTTIRPQEKVESQANKIIKIGDLEIMTENLGEMNWDEAKEACAALGDGWRLPNKDELNVLYEHKDEIGGFADSFYWSSELAGNVNAWVQGFYIGLQLPNGLDGNAYVRSVRSF